MRNKTASITVDNETAQLAEQLSRIYHKSIPNTIKLVLKKKKGLSEFKITKSVKRISGILKTGYDYKTLRSVCIDDKLEKYESIDR
jgi:hypothetical protein